jgi:crotonobetainyl-CoA:carnitine CoA-transferase CaiB-like acyl-CoA transferase
VEHWLSKLAEAGIPAGRINDLPQALSHPQLLARGMIEEALHPRAGKVRWVGSPLPLEGAEGPSTPPPLLGEHTAEILREVLGVSESDVSALTKDKVVAGPKL